jgi:hypothetical protein
MLMQLNTRSQLMEQQVRELQLNQLNLSKMMEQQTLLIKQLQQNENTLSEAVGTCLLQQKTLLNQRN